MKAFFGLEIPLLVTFLGGQLIGTQAFTSTRQFPTEIKGTPRQSFHTRSISSIFRHRGDSFRREIRSAPFRPVSSTSGLSLFPNGKDNEMSLQEGFVLTKDVEPKVYSQRWIQLAYLSLLALLSDWICFSTAATPQVYEAAFDHTSASLIDIFLFTNVATCFLVTDIVNRFGLQRAIHGASVVMLVGCWLRCGISFLPTVAGTDLMSYPFIVLGTILVGAAQPFFQCTPPLLSALWFAPSERATSTAVALNFNQIGIATAFLVGGSMATSAKGLEEYFGLIAVACTLVTAGTLLQFQDEPLIPPSASELEKKLSEEEEPPFLESVQKFLKTPGFTKALTAFICSISITNVVGAFIEEIMERGGVTQQLTIDLAGAGFELAILVGGIFIGGYVDRTKEYKNVTLACLAATALLTLPLGLSTTSASWQPILLLVSLLGLGLSAGPVQPINAELAVDVTYPGDETAVESVQQIGGNLVSALIIPIAEMAANHEYLGDRIHGDALLLCGMALATIVYFSTFDAPLKRSEADNGDDSPTVLETEAKTFTLKVDNLLRNGSEEGVVASKQLLQQSTAERESAKR